MTAATTTVTQDKTDSKINGSETATYVPPSSDHTGGTATIVPGSLTSGHRMHFMPPSATGTTASGPSNTTGAASDGPAADTTPPASWGGYASQGTHDWTVPAPSGTSGSSAASSKGGFVGHWMDHQPPAGSTMPASQS